MLHVKSLLNLSIVTGLFPSYHFCVLSTMYIFKVVVQFICWWYTRTGL